MADLSNALILLALLLALAGALRFDLLQLAFKSLLQKLGGEKTLKSTDPGLKVSTRSDPPRHAQMASQKPAIHRSGRRH